MYAATETTQGIPKVTFHEGGGVRIDDKTLSEVELEALLGKALVTGVLASKLQGGGGAGLRTMAEQLVQAEEAGDTAAMVEAFVGVAHAVVGRVAGTAAMGPQPDATPEREGLVQSLAEGEEVVKAFPLEVHNAGVQPGQLEGLSVELAPSYALYDVLESSLDKVQKGIAPRAWLGVQWLRRLGAVIGPALDNEALSAKSRGFRGYLAWAAEQGQRTKKLLERARTEAAEAATRATYEQARSEAEAAVRSDLDDRLAALLK